MLSSAWEPSCAPTCPEIRLEGKALKCQWCWRRSPCSGGTSFSSQQSGSCQPQQWTGQQGGQPGNSAPQCRLPAHPPASWPREAAGFQGAGRAVIGFSLEIRFPHRGDAPLHQTRHRGEGWSGLQWTLSDLLLPPGCPHRHPAAHTARTTVWDALPKGSCPVLMGHPGPG